MKRSKMLEIIINEIELMRGVETVDVERDPITGNVELQESFYVYPEDEIIADRILKVIENAGMIPPINTLKEDSNLKFLWDNENE